MLAQIFLEGWRLEFSDIHMLTVHPPPPSPLLRAFTLILSMVLKFQKTLVSIHCNTDLKPCRGLIAVYS